MTEQQKNDAAPQSAQGDLHPENEAQERKGLKVPRTVWALGFVSLLMDISSEMIHALLPLFMAGPLGASAVLIGLVEGAGEGAALITKVFSGAAADRFGHRKLLVFLGYALGVLSKPVFALADSVALVFAARVSDRIGKGLRGAPPWRYTGRFLQDDGRCRSGRKAGHGFWAFQLRERCGCACCRTRCRHDLGVCRSVSHFLAGLGLCCRGFRLAAFGASPPSGLCEVLSLMIRPRKPITT